MSARLLPGAYNWAAAVQTFFYTRYWRYPLRRWPRPLQALHVLLQSTITTFHFVVTVVYWALLALLASAETFDTTESSWENISIHAMNSAFTLFEFLTNAPRVPWLTLPFHILILAGYIGVAYITQATQGLYTYSFLDPTKQHAFLAAYIIGIGVGDVVVFVLARGVVVLRQRLAIRFGRLAKDDGEVMGGGEGTEAIDEWEEIERSVTGGKAERGGEGEAPRVIDSGVGVEAEAELETV
ncbi:hypothetical protein MVEN_01397700 [Mycena venus]|uniref:Uncharacterized protein n=1 Tax=Mycena venus TaxID=2733690 RepID=A0A8H6XYA0_9AGAR|nr:hypothetical protein MVEN_01397700 [Mycena venus]